MADHGCGQAVALREHHVNAERVEAPQRGWPAVPREAVEMGASEIDTGKASKAGEAAIRMRWAAAMAASLVARLDPVPDATPFQSRAGFGCRSDFEIASPFCLNAGIVYTSM